MCIHLILLHGVSPVEARELSLGARRVGERSQAYYEDISEDESSFDLLAELEEHQRESINDFDVDLLMSEECELSEGESTTKNCDSVVSVDAKENSAREEGENKVQNESEYTVQNKRENKVQNENEDSVQMELMI